MGKDDIRQKLRQVLEFGGYRKGTAREVKYVSKTLQKILDILYPLVIQAQLLYVGKEGDFGMLVSCGHYLNTVLDYKPKCSRCKYVYMLYNYCKDLYQALNPRVVERFLKCLLRDLQMKFNRKEGNYVQG